MMSRNSILSSLFGVFCLIAPAFAARQPHTSGDFDITKYGAKSGSSDISEALTNAWKDACASPTPSKVVIPKGSYVMLSAKLEGPCKAPIEVDIAGTVLAPADPAKYKDLDALLTIGQVDDLTFTGVDGGGVFDGQGGVAWKKNDCDKNKNCKGLPYNFRFNSLKNSRISHITSKDSKLFNILVFGCNNVTLEDITIIAPGDSPNTDGIHLGKSENINITRAKIGTGDDCVSIGDGIRQLHVENVECGPGHGISIGSLGGSKDQEPVSGVFVKNCTLTNTQNGVRIKTWLGSYEMAASELHFEDITINNATNPIVVDQAYCPYNHCAANVPSKVKVSNVSFRRIKGTSGSPNAVKIHCSSGVPCENVELADIDLKYTGDEGPIVSECANVKPKTSGNLNPPPCTKPPSSPPSDKDDN